MAWDYASRGPAGVASQSAPGYVFHIDLDTPLPTGVTLLDPLAELVQGYGSVIAPISYHHQGHRNFIIGVADSSVYGRVLQQSVRWPQGVLRPTAPKPEYIAMVNALRDAEVLAVGSIPRNAIIQVEPVF